MGQQPSKKFDTWQERKKGITRPWETPFLWFIWATDKILFQLRQQGLRSAYCSLSDLLNNRKKNTMTII